MKRNYVQPIVGFVDGEVFCLTASGQNNYIDMNPEWGIPGGIQ